MDLFLNIMCVLAGLLTGGMGYVNWKIRKVGYLIVLLDMGLAAWFLTVGIVGIVVHG